MFWKLTFCQCYVMDVIVYDSKTEYQLWQNWQWKNYPTLSDLKPPLRGNIDN